MINIALYFKFKTYLQLVIVRIKRKLFLMEIIFNCISIRFQLVLACINIYSIRYIFIYFNRKRKLN